MTISAAQAAAIYEHYIRLAMERAGVEITRDIDRELQEATETFARIGEKSDLA